MAFLIRGQEIYSVFWIGYEPEVTEVGRLVTNSLEVVDGELDVGGAGHGEKMQYLH